MKTVRVLIVDDEPLARDRIRITLSQDPGIVVVGEAEDGASAVAAIAELAPDVVILDVQMPGLDGFDVIRTVGVEAMPAVVFVTAYDQFALRAFEVNAVDYVLKPIDPERLGQAVARAQQRLQQTQPRIDALLELLDRTQRSRYVDRLVANEGSRLELVWVRQIEWIEAAGNYSTLHVADGEHRVRLSMTVLEEQLDPSTFVRIHRSTIVNLRAVLDIEPLYQGDYLVRLRSGRRLTSTRTYRKALLAAFGRDVGE